VFKLPEKLSDEEEASLSIYCCVIVLMLAYDQLPTTIEGVLAYEVCLFDIRSLY
jgi:hypothetical protein